MKAPVSKTSTLLTIATMAMGVMLMVSSTSPAAPAVYSLGTLGGPDSSGTSVNDSGQVSGSSKTAPNSPYRAFRYDGTPGSGGVMRDLGTLGGAESAGFSVNTTGQVAGWSGIASGRARAFRYDGTPGSGGVMHDLGTLGGDNSNGYGINDAGQVTGISNSIPGNPTWRAFRYDGTPGAGGLMRDLGTLGGAESYGNDVNNAGQVAGWSYIAEYEAHAFRYDGTPGAGGVMHDLGTFGGTYSYGVAVNNAGQVTGYSAFPKNSHYHAFRYDGTPGSGGVMHDLGTLGGTGSYAAAINDLGQIVGRSQTGNGTDHAFLYIGTPGQGGMMIDLDAWLNANNPAEGAKWILDSAGDISNTGWITGNGRFDPDGPGGIAAGPRAYLLDASSLVPEPSSAALLGVAGLALARRRGRTAHPPRCEMLEGRRLLSFTFAGSYNVGQSPQDVITADFNNDSNADLAVANWTDNTVSVLLGHGDGTFASAPTAGTGEKPHALAVGDFNRDGALDLASANAYDVSILLARRDAAGHGTGTFDPPVTITLGDGFNYPQSMDVGDFNGDGLLDIATLLVTDEASNGPSSAAAMLRGDGAGHFAAPEFTGPNVNQYFFTAAAANVNGDVYDDFVTVSSYGTVSVRLGSSTGLRHHVSFDIGGSYSYSIAAGMLDADGYTDLVIGDLNGNVTVLRGNGAGGFTSLGAFASGAQATDLALGDFNGDGELDVATARKLLDGRGDGTLGAAADLPVGNGYAVTASNFNGDGRPDVAVSNAGSNSVSVLLNTTDNVAPTIGAAQFPFLLAPHRISIPFSEPVGPSLSLSDMTVQNQTTATTAEPVSLSYDQATNTATFSFASVLQDGNYRAAIAAANVTDLAGNPLPDDFLFEFFFLNGDANRDRIIDIGDFAIVAGRFNQPGSFSQGDFNYDGTTDIGDFAILAAKFNLALPVLRSPPAGDPRGTFPTPPAAGFSLTRIDKTESLATGILI